MMMILRSRLHVLEIGNTKLHVRDGGDISVGRRTPVRSRPARLLPTRAIPQGQIDGPVEASSRDTDHIINSDDERESRLDRSPRKIRSSSQPVPYPRS